MSLNVLGLSFLLLTVPVLIALYVKHIDHHNFTWSEFGGTVAVSFISLVGLMGFAGAQQVRDTEVWNGRLVDKERVEDSYLETWETCSGTGEGRRCVSHSEWHYTTDWYLVGDVGKREKIHVDGIDSTSKWVAHNAKDPAVYQRARIGEPLSVEKHFNNYIRAASDSLYNDELVTAYADSIPAYPSVYDHYKIKRVLVAGAVLDRADILDLNEALAEMLATAGPKHEVNVNVVLTDIADPSYLLQLQSAWLGGKKNDVTVAMGIREGEMVWADAFTYGNSRGNELFTVTLRDELSELEAFDAKAVSDTIGRVIAELYDRPHESDFEYLKAEISVSLLAIIASLVTTVIGCLALTHYLRNNSIRSNY